jgi:transcriptional regulator with XRE-family HTH domain
MESLIHVRRAERHMRQIDLAEASGVSKNAICWWERGHISGARLENLLSIAKALGCEVTDLYKDEEVDE